LLLIDAGRLLTLGANFSHRIARLHLLSSVNKKARNSSVLFAGYGQRPPQINQGDHALRWQHLRLMQETGHVQCLTGAQR